MQKQLQARLEQESQGLGVESDGDVYQNQQKNGGKKSFLSADSDPSFRIRPTGVKNHRYIHKVNDVEDRTHRQGQQDNHGFVGKGERGQSEIQLGNKPGENREADHGEGPAQESKPCGWISVGRAPQGREIPSSPGGVNQRAAGKKQDRLSDGVGTDVEEYGDHGLFGTHADPHKDISDLGSGGKRSHFRDGAGPDRRDGSYDHPCNTEQEKDILHPRFHKYAVSVYPIDNFDEQKNISLRNHTGKDAGGGRRGGAVGIRHPEMEGKESAFDSQTADSQPDRDDHDSMVCAAAPGSGHCLLQLGKQKVACHAVQHGDAHQKHPGSDQIKDHIAGSGNQRLARVPDHQKAAGGQRTDFNKHISGEYIIGIAQGKHGHLGKIHKNIVEMLLIEAHICGDSVFAGCNGAEHHYTEQQGKEGFQQSCGNFVSPGRGEMPHAIGKGRSGYQIVQ